MYQIGVGKIKLPRFEIANHFDLGHSRVIEAVIAYFLASNRFKPCLSWKEGGRGGRKGEP